MARRAQNGGSRCRRCFQTPCIREIRHSLTHISTLPSLCDRTLGVRRRRSSGKLPVIEDGISGSRDPSHSFFQGQISLTRMVHGVRANAIAVLSFLCFHALNPKPEFLTNGAVHFLGSRPPLEHAPPARKEPPNAPGPIREYPHSGLLDFPVSTACPIAHFSALFPISSKTSQIPNFPHIAPFRSLRFMWTPLFFTPGPHTEPRSFRAPLSPISRPCSENQRKLANFTTPRTPRSCRSDAPNSSPPT